MICSEKISNIITRFNDKNQIKENSILLSFADKIVIMNSFRTDKIIALNNTLNEPKTSIQ